MAKLLLSLVLSLVSVMAARVLGSPMPGAVTEVTSSSTGQPSSPTSAGGAVTDHTEVTISSTSQPSSPTSSSIVTTQAADEGDVASSLRLAHWRLATLTGAPKCKVGGSRICSNRVWWNCTDSLFPVRTRESCTCFDNRSQEYTHKQVVVCPRRGVLTCERPTPKNKKDAKRLKRMRCCLQCFNGEFRTVLQKKQKKQV
eukprot:scpid87814/ scgid28208/ 